MLWHTTLVSSVASFALFLFLWWQRPVWNCLSTTPCMVLSMYNTLSQTVCLMQTIHYPFIADRKLFWVGALHMMNQRQLVQQIPRLHWALHKTPQQRLSSNRHLGLSPRKQISEGPSTQTAIRWFSNKRWSFQDLRNRDDSSCGLGMTYRPASAHSYPPHNTSILRSCYTGGCRLLDVKSEKIYS